MKVAMLTYLGEDSGVCTHAKNIAPQITKNPDVDLHIIAIGDENIITNKFGATVHFIKRVNFRGATFFHYPFAFRKKIKEINPDIIHVQGYARYYYIAVALLRKYPFILTLHSNLSEELEYRLPPSLKKYVSLKIEPYLEKRLVRKAEQIIVPSPHMKEYHAGMKDKVLVIPNGIDFEEIQNSSRAEADLTHPAILFVGRLEKIKGVGILIKSISFVASSIPDVHLFIAGKGEEESELKYLVKKIGIEDNVTFLGFIPVKEIYSYYRSADIFVAPSFSEAFPLVSLEAMACGKPLLCFFKYWNWYDSSPPIISTNLPEEIANNIKRLIIDKTLRENFETQNREWVKKYHNMQEIVQKFIYLYGDILHDHVRTEKDNASGMQ